MQDNKAKVIIESSMVKNNEEATRLSKFFFYTDAELFPDEIEEYTPEERRKGFTVHIQGKNSKGK